MRIDAHQHFWMYNDSDYGWIDESMLMLRRDFLPGDLEPELLNAGFGGTVAVQARQTAAETRWLLQLAEKHDMIRGVVGWVDLCNEQILKEQLDEFSAYPKMIGVRHVVHDEPDNSFMLRDDFLKGLSLLEKYGLAYDFLLFPKHLKTAGKVAGMFPRQRFVLDHIAKPQIKDAKINPWQEDLFRLAQHQNVHCKLSGMVTEADWQHNTPGDFYPYLDTVFEAFGNDRLMTGSDWPVCLLGGSYSYVTGIVKNYISGIPEHIREKILGKNCMEFYRIHP